MIRLGSNFTQLRFQRAKFQEVEEKKTEDKKAEEKKAEDTAPKEENKNDGTNTKKTDLSNFFDQNYLLPITFKPIKTKPTPAVPENNDEPEVDEKDEETPTTNKTDGVSGNENETKKLTEDEIKATIKKVAPDITDYQMNQLLTTISSYDNLDSSSIESAVKRLMRYYKHDNSKITSAANTINADTKESLMQEDFRSIINYYTAAVDKNSSGEKNKPTTDDLNNMFTDYKNTMEKVRGMYNPSNIYEDLIIHLQGVIDRNNLDTNLNNLMSFFEYIQKNMPTGGAMFTNEWLITEFNNFIENGYTDERASLDREADRLHNSFVDNNGTSTPENNDTTTNNTKMPTPEELERINKAIDDNINKAFDVFK